MYLKMYTINNSTMFLHFILLIITIDLSIVNSVDLSDYSGSELKQQILHLLEPFDKESSLPKNYIFTHEEIQNNTRDYLEGLKNEDVTLNGTQLIQKYGYDVEEHHVTTSDGYVLSMYRIPAKGDNKGVVFLMHGLLSSFADWLTAGPDKGLAYILAALGYDVWMGNARGNTYSNKNINLSSSDPKFWDFSWDEIGRLDLPAMIDYVLEETGQEKLVYIGHSQGTTAFFVLCSEKPQYNDKISLMISLSAVAWMKHITSPLLRIGSEFHDIIYLLGRGLGFNEVLPDNDLKKAITLTLCGNSFLASAICQNVGFLLFGFDYSQINYKQSPVIFNHNPSSSSLRQLNHYAQLVLSGYFRNYDYGPAENLIKYRSPTPPSYPVDKITVPIVIFYSYNDWLSNTIDVNVLRSKLKNVVGYYEVPLRTFNHNDYIFAKDVKSLVYDKVTKLISDFS